MPSLLDNPAFIAACKPKKFAAMAAKPKKKQKKPEAIISDNIIAYLLGCGWLAVRFNSLKLPSANGGRISAYTAHGKRGKLNVGINDLIAFRGDRAKFIEVKTPEKARRADRGMSDSQRAFEKLLVDFGIKYYLASSVDDVRKILQEVND